jgi:hypothetical protein
MTITITTSITMTIIITTHTEGMFKRPKANVMLVLDAVGTETLKLSETTPFLQALGFDGKASATARTLSLPAGEVDAQTLMTTLASTGADSLMQSFKGDSLGNTHHDRNSLTSPRLLSEHHD